MTKKKALALYTGGKDSHYAMLKAQENGYIIDLVVIVHSAREDSWMFHTVNTRWAKLHVKAMGKQLVELKVSGKKEKEINELLEHLRKLKDKYDFEAIVTGAVASRYQKKRVDLIAENLDVEHFSPLWGLDQEDVLREEVERIEFIITAVQAYGLTDKWLGQRIDKNNVEEFLRICRKYQISPIGEGGEFETFVLYSPLMSKRVRILKARKEWYPQGYGYYIIDEAVLE